MISERPPALPPLAPPAPAAQGAASAAAPALVAPFQQKVSSFVKAATAEHKTALQLRSDRASKKTWNRLSGWQRGQPTKG